MRGLMMNRPLLLTHFLERANALYPKQEIVSRMPEGVHRTTYAEVFERVRRLSRSLADLGVAPGERVATFAWNHFRHLELYFAAPASQRVLHTLNIRLFPEQVVFIANHAEDRVVFVDDVLVPVLEKVASELKSVKAYVVMGGDPPKSSLKNVLKYEDLVSKPAPDYEFPVFDENEAAAMCYTSGTTGNPKGVLYSHRALFLQAMSHAMVDTMGLSDRDVILSVVPMFHANCWCLPFAGTMAGAKQVYPHQHLQPEHLVPLLEEEKVTFSAGVPTIWTGVLDHLDREKKELPHLKRAICGGSAVPLSLIDRCEKRGISLMQGWGMTETSPLGTVARVKAGMGEMSRDARLKILAKQGPPVPCVELRVVDDQGKIAPHDGKSMGELEIRGPWIIGEYYDDERSPASFHDGWFKTGDLVKRDEDGYFFFLSRIKDIIRRRGENIAGAELDRVIGSHAAVHEAAAVAVPAELGEDEILVAVVLKPGAHATAQDIADWCREHLAPQKVPRYVLFVDELPHTPTHKVAKAALKKDATLKARAVDLEAKS